MNQHGGSNGSARRELCDVAPPCNVEIDQCLLSDLIAHPAAFNYPEVAAVRTGDFTDDFHRTIFSTVVTLYAEYGDVPQTLLIDKLSANGNWNAAEFSRVLRATVNAANVRAYADEVREKSRLRQLQFAATVALRGIADGLKVDDVLCGLTRDVEAIGAEQSTARRFQKMTAAALDAVSDDVPYIVPNVLAEVQPCAMVGGSKMLKTTVTCDLVLSSCWEDSNFLGFFPVAKQIRAWFLSGESGDAVIKETCRRIARAAGREFKQTEGFYYSSTLPQLSNPADVAELGREIKGDGITLLVIDPLYLAADTQGREGSVFAMGPMLRRVNEACIKNGCTPIIVHHGTQAKAKSKDYSPPQLNDASWAGIEQFARQWILVGRREAYRDGSGEHRLWLSTGGSAGHGGLYHLDINEGTRQTPGGRFWDANVTPANEAQAVEHEHRAAAAADREQRRQAEHRQKILDALKACPKGETRRALRQSTGLNDANFSEAMRALLGDHLVEICEVRKHTTIHDGYRLASPQKELCRDMAGQGEFDAA